MPDFDCDYDDLELLGNVIGGETYLQWTDRLRPGGVAALNDTGQVVDSEGRPVTGSESAAIVQGNLDAEVVERMQGDQFLRQYFLQFAEEQITAVYNTTANNLAFQVNQLSERRSHREDGTGQRRQRPYKTPWRSWRVISRSRSGTLDDAIGNINEEMATKADLVNGKIPSDQIPSIAIGNAVSADDEADMLALTTAEVQPGDLCVRPDGTFMLNANPPSVLGNWVKLSDAASVSSVNGQTGAVVLSAVNVGARPATQPIPQTDITGLLNSLNGKTDVSRHRRDPSAADHRGDRHHHRAHGGRGHPARPARRRRGVRQHRTARSATSRARCSSAAAPGCWRSTTSAA